MIDPKDYWQKKHKKYAQEDWITKPTIFAKFVISYFPSKGKILELGAGLEQDSRFFTEKGYEVKATDFTKEDENYLDLGEKFQLPDRSFDVVYSHLALHYFDNKTTSQLFNEISRVIKSDGILAILLNTVEDPEVKESTLISEDLYETPSGIRKRFFSTTSLEKFTKGNFETILLDAKGETYKDEVKTLIRYIGKKR